MKASPLLIAWHNDNAPIYSAHFEPHGKGRLATSGGDNNVRLWRVETEGEDRKVTYLTTLIKVETPCLSSQSSDADQISSIPKQSMSYGLLLEVDHHVHIPSCIPLIYARRNACYSWRRRQHSPLGTFRNPQQYAGVWGRRVGGQGDVESEAYVSLVRL